MNKFTFVKFCQRINLQIIIMKTLEKIVWIIIQNDIDLIYTGNPAWGRNKTISEFMKERYNYYFNWVHKYKQGYRCRKVKLTINIK